MNRLSEGLVKLRELEEQRAKLATERPDLVRTDAEVDSGRHVEVSIGKLAELDEKIKALGDQLEAEYDQVMTEEYGPETVR